MTWNGLVPKLLGWLQVQRNIFRALYWVVLYSSDEGHTNSCITLFMQPVMIIRHSLAYAYNVYV
jgi:hypothetical protein